MSEEKSSEKDYTQCHTFYDFESQSIVICKGAFSIDALGVDEYGKMWAFTKEELE